MTCRLYRRVAAGRVGGVHLAVTNDMLFRPARWTSCFTEDILGARMTRPPPALRSSRSPRARMLLRLLRGWRVTLASALNVTEETRTAGVRRMIHGHGKEGVAYWFQLVLSMGIATYGLVLGSTGVVIGAMLVSPLMGPIVEIGMGLVTGSPVLVAYAAVRTFSSVALVVAGSALLTLALPYHEVNSEILSRTAPTLIDLYVACFCALAAAYTTARQSSDTVSAAAGTSISIALVPPLCVVGWGFGSGRAAIARGAAMLFTANLCAIVLLSVVAFFLLAYDSVPVDALEEEGAEGGTRLHQYVSRFRGAFGSRYSPLLRLGMPLMFAAAIYVPLRTALSEVAWKVRARDSVQRIVAETPSARQAVRSTINVEMNAITVRLVIVGDAKAATSLKSDLAARILARTSVSPIVDVVAVPDLEAVRLANQALVDPVTVVARQTLSGTQKDVGDQLKRWWPTASAGELATWSVIAPGDGPVKVEVVHFGRPLGPSGEALLASALHERLGVEAQVRDIALPIERVELEPDRGALWISTLAGRVDALIQTDRGYVCVTAPSKASRAKPNDPVEATRRTAIEQLARLGPQRGNISPGPTFAAWISQTPCAVDDSDAGVSDAATKRR